MAVGDGINDVEMMVWAAHGVAMGNSPVPGLALADEICPAAAGEGLATALSQ